MTPLYEQSRCQSSKGTPLALTGIRSKHGTIRTALNWPAYHVLAQSVFLCRHHAPYRALCAPVLRPKEKAKAEALARGFVAVLASYRMDIGATVVVRWVIGN